MKLDRSQGKLSFWYFQMEKKRTQFTEIMEKAREIFQTIYECIRCLQMEEDSHDFLASRPFRFYMEVLLKALFRYRKKSESNI